MMLAQEKLVADTEAAHTEAVNAARAIAAREPHTDVEDAAAAEIAAAEAEIAAAEAEIAVAEAEAVAAAEKAASAAVVAVQASAIQPAATDGSEEAGFGDDAKQVRIAMISEPADVSSNAIMTAHMAGVEVRLAVKGVLVLWHKQKASLEMLVANGSEHFVLAFSEAACAAGKVAVYSCTGRSYGDQTVDWLVDLIPKRFPLSMTRGAASRIKSRQADLVAVASAKRGAAAAVEDTPANPNHALVKTNERQRQAASEPDLRRNVKSAGRPGCAPLICGFWPKHMCRDGDKCASRHVGEGGVVGSGPASVRKGVKARGAAPEKLICRHYQRGACNNGNSCSFEHVGDIPQVKIAEVCERHLIGRCRAGNACLRIHDGAVAAAGTTWKERMNDGKDDGGGGGGGGGSGGGGASSAKERERAARQKARNLKSHAQARRKRERALSSSSSSSKVGDKKQQ